GGTPRGMRESISSSAAFVQTGFSLDRLDVGAGVRLERHGTDALVSRLPGFVTFVPDSLRGDAYIMTAGDGPWEERLQRLEECGGAATAADRTNPITGVAV